MNELDPAKRDKLLALFREGVGVRKAASEVGCHRDTAMRLRRKYVAENPIKPIEYKVAPGTANELKYLRAMLKRLDNIVDHYLDHGPDATLERLLLKAADVIDLRKSENE